MKKILICAFCLFLLASCAKQEQPSHLIMINNILYRSTGEVISQVYPRNIIGHVESYTEGIPTESGQANFNPELGAPYAMTDASWFVVKVEDEWFRFRVEDVFWDGELKPFSFQDDLLMYAGITLEELEAGATPEDDWIRTESFVNVTPSPVQTGEDAVRRAANECSFDFIDTTVYYDKETDMWCVLFWDCYAPGGGLSVYLDGDGITRLIVPGE